MSSKKHANSFSLYILYKIIYPCRYYSSQFCHEAGTVVDISVVTKKKKKKDFRNEFILLKKINSQYVVCQSLRIILHLRFTIDIQRFVFMILR